jgi:hypothetical protein
MLEQMALINARMDAQPADFVAAVVTAAADPVLLCVVAMRSSTPLAIATH